MHYIPTPKPHPQYEAWCRKHQGRVALIPQCLERLQTLREQWNPEFFLDNVIVVVYPLTYFLLLLCGWKTDHPSNKYQNRVHNLLYLFTHYAPTIFLSKYLLNSIKKVFFIICFELSVFKFWKCTIFFIHNTVADLLKKNSWTCNQISWTCNQSCEQALTQREKLKMREIHNIAWDKEPCSCSAKVAVQLLYIKYVQEKLCKAVSRKSQKREFHHVVSSHQYTTIFLLEISSWPGYLFVGFYNNT